MKKLTHNALLLLLTLFISFAEDSASAQITSAGSACNFLLKESALKHLAAKASPDGYYDCAPDRDTNGYFVLGLHYRLKNPGSVASSSLVGWYAVSKSNGQLYEWDMANQTIGDVIEQRSKP